MPEGMVCMHTRPSTRWAAMAAAVAVLASALAALAPAAAAVAAPATKLGKDLPGL